MFELLRLLFPITAIVIGSISAFNGDITWYQNAILASVNLILLAILKIEYKLYNKN